MAISRFVWISCSVLCVLWISLRAVCCLTLCCSLMAPWCNLAKIKKIKKLIATLSCWCVLATLCDKTSVSSCSDLKLRVRILIDGTLIIFRVKPEDAGKYTCSPSNSLGISPSASAYLTVQCECYHGNKVAGEGREQAVCEEKGTAAAAVWRLLMSEAAVLFGSAALSL